MHSNFAENHKEGRQIISDLRSALIFKAIDHPRIVEGYDLPAFASAMWNGVQILWTPVCGTSTDEISLISITTPVCMRGQGKGKEAFDAFLQAVDELGLRVRAFVHPRETVYTQRITEWFDSVGFTIDGPNCGRGVTMTREAQVPALATKTLYVAPVVNAPIVPDAPLPVAAREMARV